jgi:DNA (cytosine-5)-methyltransferase 1
MRLLDLFCGGGGASAGYVMAGFDVVGVDIVKKKSYPYEFYKANAIEVLKDKKFIAGFDIIHASPPCQFYSITGNLMRAQGKTTSKPDLLAEVRDLLIATSKPYIIENVPGAPMTGITLCGSMFGLKVRRHRIFESSMPLMTLECDHKSQGRPVGVYGSINDEIPKGGRTAKTLLEGQLAMGIDWLGWGDLKESIPPAYTKYLGEQVLNEPVPQT